MQPRVHSEPLHARELRIAHLVQMRENPAQTLDRLDLVELLELAEVGLDRVFHLDVGVQEHSAFGDRLHDAAHLAHVLGLDHEIVAQQVGRRGLID